LAGRPLARAREAVARGGGANHDGRVEKEAGARVTSDGTAQQVTEHVHRIDAGALGLYLIVLPEGLTLIDAGFPGTMPAIEETVSSLGRRAQEIDNILVTHCHPDHAAGLAEVKRSTKAQVWMHPADAELVRSGRPFRPWKVAPGLGNHLFAWRVIRREPPTFEPASVDKEVNSGAEIPVAGGMRAIGTPGHTAGHLNARGLAPATIYEDYQRGLDDLRMIGGYEFKVACFAHGAPLVGGAAREFRRRWA
jgi:hypothetical protein